MRSALRNAVAALTILAAAGFAEALAQSPTVPDLTGSWQRNDQPFMDFLAPPSGQGPLRVHPNWKRAAGDNKPFIGDASDPLLKPWAAAVIKDRAYRQVVNGEEILPAHSLCWPSGVPGALRIREPVEFLQTPREITMIYQRDHQVRRIYLDVPHSKNPPKTWYGESVGHYEGGTLVVDTIGMNDKTTVDWYGTPHTDAIHTIERYRMIGDQRTMEVEFTVDDPATFTKPWTGIVHYRRGPAVVEEIVCAENNKNAQTGKDYPIPISDHTDF